MIDNEKIEDFLLCIVESQEYEKVSYIFFNIRRSPMDYITRKRCVEIEPFMKPLHEYIKGKLIDLELDLDVLLSYIIEKDNHSWCFHFILTRFKRKENVEEFVYYNTVALGEGICSLIELDYDIFAILVLGFTISYFSKNIIDIEEIVQEEVFAYQTNQYGLTKINGAVFKRDGLCYDKKYYLYNILTDTKVIDFTDKMPAFARIITEQITSGDILYRLDERLAVPEEQIISYSTLNFEKFYGPQFRFNDSILDTKKTIIVHMDENTMDKLLMVIKQCKDMFGESFWHIEIETLPYVDGQKKNINHIITTFLHGMYYPNKDIFTHIDYTRNQYRFSDYLLKYSESNNDVPIDYYTEKELHYKIWCVENGEYSRKTWYDFMIASLTPKYQKLLNELLQ